MSATAVVMMLVALVFVWGGLAASIVHLRKHPDPEDD
ncbi:methionine/alanine import family NSS transporter small subunit [Rhodococcus sp. HNM0569]|nr:methionine/alanine import family NSS transporter small subunit [Rhodococcus sp. HNM0569]NLU83065.1 methionine/alanine import family NSS transporter small subunit [Rhodococcus sp. HNM0569]